MTSSLRLRPLTSLLAAAAIAASIASAGTPPAGFVETVLVPSGAGGVNGPVAVAYEPGTDDLWILEKGGGGQARIRVRDAGTGAVTTLFTLTGVDSAGERGLLGIAFDPDYLDPIAPAPYVYLYYTSNAGSIHNRVSRFTVGGGTLSSELILLEGPPLGPTNHNGGTVRFAADETLYISMGDNNSDGRAESQWSQDLRDLRGKILRINRDGSIPADNPFAGSLSLRNEIWCYGLRNPFRMAFDSATDALYIADVGEVTWESVYVGLRGANHGYPCWEGPAPYGNGIPSAYCTSPPDPVGVTFPIYSYGHGGQTPPVSGNSITGGPVYRGTAFPAEYQGNYFFADYGQMPADGIWIRRARIAPDGRLVDVEMFVPDAPGVVDLAVSPAGCLVYVSLSGDGVREICYVGGANSQPQAVATGTPLAGLAPLDVQFTGSASSDPDLDALAFDWQFGDATSDTIADPLHQYVGNGVYQAVLTVDDGQGQANSTDTAAPLRVVVGNRPPSVSVTLPANGSPYVAGAPVDFAGVADDPEDGPLAPDAFEWTVVFHHAAHTHPFLGPIRDVDRGQFTIPNDGEDAQDVFYRIHATATDSGAPLGANGRLSGSAYVDVVPIIADVTVSADPMIPGVQVEVNALAQAAPASARLVAGFALSIGAPSPQVLGPRTLTFETWQDGDTNAQRVVYPQSAAVEYRARFLCNVIEEVQDLRVRKGSASNLVVCTWQPVADICLNDIVDGVVYRVWSSDAARPTALPGAWPADPPFAVAQVSDWTETVDFDPGPGPVRYLLVTAVGRDLGDGPVGHYPTP